MINSFRNRLSSIISSSNSRNINFKTKTLECWSEFENKEAKIRQLMTDKADSNSIVKSMNSIFKIAFHDIAFEMGINKDGKHELILSPNGNRILLMQILYFLEFKPKHLDGKWNFYSTKPAQGHNGLALNIYSTTINADDFSIYTDLNEEKKIILLKVYAPILSKLQEADKYNAFFIMLDLFIGELYTMEYIGHIEIIENKKNCEHIPLSKMKAYIDYLINEHEWKKPQNIAENYTAYTVKNDNTTNELRKDVFIGYSSCFEIIRELENKEIYPIKELELDGVYIGYIYYDNSSISQDAVVAQRTEIEDTICELLQNKKVAHHTGGATGYKYSYIDFIIYDFEIFIKIAKKVMLKYNYKEKGFAYIQSANKTITF